MLFKKENYQIKTNSIGFYQDLEHVDGVGISAVSANLYLDKKRDELVIFYFRKGANHASVFNGTGVLLRSGVVVARWRRMLAQQGFSRWLTPLISLLWR